MPPTSGRRMPTRRPASGRTAPSPAPSTDSAASSGNIAVPKTNRDPVWSLCPWPVTVQLPGLEFEIEPLPAVDWLQYLLNAQGPDFMGLIGELMPDLEDYYLDTDDEPDVDGLRETVLDIIATVGARPWWQVLRLTMMAAGSWDVLGPKLLMNGANPVNVSLAAWLDVLVVTVLENIEPSKAMMFTLQLEAVPVNLLSEDEVAGEFPEMNESAFLAMASE